MPYIVYEVKMPDSAVYLVKFWISDNPAMTDGCDSCIGWSLFDARHAYLDGGEMDYDSQSKDYMPLEKCVPDLIDFIWDGKAPESFGPSGVDPDDLED